jgi:hypothetical protein
MYPYIKFELNVCNHCRDIINGNWKFLFFFSKFKRDSSVKNQHTITKFNLDLHILMMNLYMQYQPYTCHTHNSSRAETENFYFFQSSRGITLSKINEPWPKLQKQFQPYTYIQTKVTEQKLKKIFKRNNSVKNHQTATKFKLDLRNPPLRNDF